MTDLMFRKPNGSSRGREEQVGDSVVVHNK